MIDNVNDSHPTAARKKAKKLKDKRDYKKLIKEKWNKKPMHGKFQSYLDKEHIDDEQSLKWMKHSGVKR